MKLIVLDSESDDLWQDATKIHVLSWTEDGKTFQSTNDDSVAEGVFEGVDYFVCHNGIRHDKPLFEKIWGIKTHYTQWIDTLALSWYINFDLNKHGLEDYGLRYGVPKPKVTDWKGLSYEEYKHRCEEDVKINWKLWTELKTKLISLYPKAEDRKRILNYLSFKMDCAREQEDIGWRLDVDKAQKHFDKLAALQDSAVEEVKSVMPKVNKYKKKSKPKVMYRKDGSLSANGERWIELLDEHGLPHNWEDDVEVFDREEEPNPNSTDQIKDWLNTLGWEPRTFKYLKNKDTGEERKIPQVRKQGELCESVVELAESVPELKALTDLAIIQHRLGVFKGFLNSHKDGWLEAKVNGLTNTLRFKHSKPLVNLPGVDKPWGKEIRECLIAPTSEHDLIGADMVSLESTTKRHFIHPHDPEYAEEMSQPGFDEHLDLAVKSGALTKQQYKFYQDCTNESDASFKAIHAVRKKYKPVNYSAVYGVGAPKLSREAGMSLEEAKQLLEAYWDRNWAVKAVASEQQVKKVDGQLWLLNPVSKFWYQLRYEKDIFSTLNQGTGVFIFDSWVARVRARGIKICGQFHDEIAFWTLRKEQDKYKLQRAVEDLNESLDLNVTIGIDAKVGKDYAQVH